MPRPAERARFRRLCSGSAVAGFSTPQSQIRTLLAHAGVSSGALALVYGASALDLILGVLALLNRQVAAAAGLMLICLLCYTAFIGTTLPALWLEPFGGLLKNLALMPAVLVLMATANPR